MIREAHAATKDHDGHRWERNGYRNGRGMIAASAAPAAHLVSPSRSATHSAYAGYGPMWVEGIYARCPTIGSLIEIGALRALALAATGQEAAALDALAGALTLACPQGYVRAFATRGRQWPRCWPG